MTTDPIHAAAIRWAAMRTLILRRAEHGTLPDMRKPEFDLGAAEHALVDAVRALPEGAAAIDAAVQAAHEASA